MHAWQSERYIQGIDCGGNVFACAWGGYVTDDLSNNPFYLGNIYKDDLKTILNSEKAIKLSNGITRGTCNCRVFNYFASENNDIISDTDPLIVRKKG